MSRILGIKYDENNKYHRFGRTAVITVISLSLFIFIWWAVSVITNNTAIPTPVETWNSLVDLYQNGDKMTHIRLGQYISSSLSTFIKGFLLAFAVAVPLGLILGYSKVLRDFANPVIEVMRPIAPIAWAPIFMLSLGYSVGPVLVVFVGIFFPLLTNVIFGVRKIDPNWIDASKTLGASQVQIFYKVMMPSAIPYVMNGIKVGLGIGWMCIVAAELYATPLGGIGFYLAEQATIGNWPGAYAALVIIGVLGLLTIGVSDYLHRLLSRRMGMEV
ncbi:MAG: ABC transporter permease [Candidatus Methanoplasma sp.]|jgi:NitT/TauT family transport system permease protein|nr:ABC transporter permease [Candidatus Methanoplasma sp.]